MNWSPHTIVREIALSGNCWTIRPGKVHAKLVVSFKAYTENLIACRRLGTDIAPQDFPMARETVRRAAHRAT
jgi:hypothetical protein